MNYDFKIFLRYLLDKHFHPKNYINSSAFYEYLLMGIFIYSFFTAVSLRNKAIITICFIIAISFTKFLSLYKSGRHRRWNRDKLGIPTKSEIQKLKNFKSLNF